MYGKDVFLLQANSLMNSFTNSNNRNQVGAGGRITDQTFTDTLR